MNPHEPGTEYVVAWQDPDHDFWAVYGTFRAANDKQAIRQAIHDGLAGDKPAYIAVPARSWQPRTPTVDTKPKVTF